MLQVGFTDRWSSFSPALILFDQMKISPGKLRILYSRYSWNAFNSRHSLDACWTHCDSRSSRKDTDQACVHVLIFPSSLISIDAFSSMNDYQSFPMQHRRDIIRNFEKHVRSPSPLLFRLSSQSPSVTTISKLWGIWMHSLIVDYTYIQLSSWWLFCNHLEQVWKTLM